MSVCPTLCTSSAVKKWSVRDRSIFLCPFPVLLASHVSSRSQRFSCCFSAGEEGVLLCRAVCRCESCPASPRHCRSGSPRQERGRAPCTTNDVSSSKAPCSFVPAGCRKKGSSSFSQSAVCLPMCENVCAPACLSAGKGPHHQ